MKIEEALEYAKNVSFCRGCSHFAYGCTDIEDYVCDRCEHRQFFDIVIKTLELRIPKKPTKAYIGYADLELYPVLGFFCPNCGKSLDDTDHHCECGQAIDWNE